MTSLDAMKVFAEVARQESFTGAARVLGMPLSSVSRRVSDLEAGLNTRLIDRSKRRIRLTQAGAVYFELCRKGLDTLAYANRVMNDRHSDTSGTIAITVPPTLLDVLFLKPIEAFQLNYPRAKLHILISERLLDFTGDAVDLSFRVAPPEQKDLVAKVMVRYRHRLVASAGYAAIHPLPQTPDELEGHRRIGFGFSMKRTACWRLERQGQLYTAEFDPELAVNDYAAIRAMVLSGQGIGELPEPLCLNRLHDGQLMEVLPGWRLPEVKLFAVHTGKVALPKLARIFLDFVAAQLKKAI